MSSTNDVPASWLDIDVRFEAPEEAPQMRDNRPILTWESAGAASRLPATDSGWVLWYLDDPASPSAGVETHVLAGVAADDAGTAVADAQAWLRAQYGALDG